MASSSDETEQLLPSVDPYDVTQSDRVGSRRETTGTRHASFPTRRSKWFLVEPIVIIYLMSVFPTSIITQKYVLEWMENDMITADAARNISHYKGNDTSAPCHTNVSDPEYIFQQMVQSRSSTFGLFQSIVWGIPAFFMNLILGTGSDLYGRRFAVIPPAAGSVMCSSIVTLIVWMKAPIYWFLVSDIIYGFCGSFAAMFMGCFSYVAERTPPEKRMIRITVIEMCMLISAVASSMALGTIIQKFGFLYPMLFLVTTAALNLIYIVLFFPRKVESSKDINANENTEESGNREIEQEYENSEMPKESDNLTLPKESENMPQTYRKTSSSLVETLMAQLRTTVAIFMKSSSTRLKLNVLLLAFLVTNLAAFSTSVSTLFQMNSPLCWTVDRIGLFSGVSLGVSASGAMIITPLMKRCYVPDYVIAILAGLSAVAVSIYTAFVKTSVMMFLTLGIGLFRILFTPSLRSLMSGQVREDQQGAVFGAIACLEVFCSTIGTVTFNSIYSATLLISTGFVFLVMGFFYAVGCILVCWFAILQRLDLRRERGDLHVSI